jgi:hypothetical protein
MVVPKYGNNSQQIVSIGQEDGSQGRRDHAAPGHLHAESTGHVHQQDERQELEIARVAVIGNEDLGCQATEPKGGSVGEHGATDSKAQDFRHSGEIGGDVDGVGQHQ